MPSERNKTQMDLIGELADDMANCRDGARPDKSSLIYYPPSFK